MSSCDASQSVSDVPLLPAAQRESVPQDRVPL